MNASLRPLPTLLAVALAGGLVAACGSSGPARTAPAPACRSIADCPASTTTCETATCADGTCGFDPSPATSTCNDAGGRVCDGAGACVECNVDADCPAPTDACAQALCAGHACSIQNNPGYTPPDVPNDCQHALCVGGTAQVTFDPSEVVTVTGNPCTEVVCFTSGLAPDPVTIGTDLRVFLDQPCSGGGGPGYCNPAGDCTECTLPSQCPASPVECMASACSANTFTCGFAPVALDPLTACSAGTGRCDGAGSCVVP